MFIINNPKRTSYHNQLALFLLCGNLESEVVTMYCVKFKYQDERFVYQKLIDQINILCTAKGKDCLCTSGYRSLEKQKIINAQSLAQRKSQGGYQRADGSVYTPDGKCWAAAYGKSNHCYCIAMDITDDWFNKLSNAELKVSA